MFTFVRILCQQYVDDPWSVWKNPVFKKIHFFASDCEE